METFHHPSLAAHFRACLHGGGEPQIAEVTCGGSPHPSCKRGQIIMRDYMDGRVTSPTWGPPPPCKQGLRLLCILQMQFTFVGSLSFVIGSLSTDDGDGNGNVTKSSIGLIGKKNFARASHFFVHFFAVTLSLPREIPLCDVLLRT